MPNTSQSAALRTVFAGERATGRQLRKARLVVVDGPDRGSSVLISKARTFVGRSRVNDFVLTDTSISGTHFELVVSEDGYLLRDLGSTNGVRYAGLRVREIYLEPGCTFQAGNTSLRFVPSDELVDIPLSAEDRFGEVLGRSVAMRELFATLEKVAPSDLTVLLEGETGTGKEVVARSLHQRSRRKQRPFVVLDCSSIPKDLMESTVFGHEKGAFTGAIARHEGAFEQANGGTIFMDEIGELELSLQPKLLRVLENRELKRVGGHQTLRVDVRVVAATNRDLRQMVADGTFREDLYFRLSVIQVPLPPLRARAGDLPLLIDHFLDMFAKHRPDRKRLALSPDAQASLERHPWPGNVRELKNVIERAVSLCDGGAIQRHDLLLNAHLRAFPSSAPASAPAHAPPSLQAATAAAASTPEASAHDPSGGDDVATFSVGLSPHYKDAKQALLDQFELRYIQRIYDAHDGNISRAAKAAGLTRYHLRELLKKHGIVEGKR